MTSHPDPRKASTVRASRNLFSLNFEHQKSIRDLERLTKPLNVSPADEYAGKREECLMDIGTALVADA